MYQTENFFKEKKNLENAKSLFNIDISREYDRNSSHVRFLKGVL